MNRFHSRRIFKSIFKTKSFALLLTHGWIESKDKIGCEFPISKLFYEYQPLRSVEDILADIRALEEDEEQELSSLLND